MYSRKVSKDYHEHIIKEKEDGFMDLHKKSNMKIEELQKKLETITIKKDKEIKKYKTKLDKANAYITSLPDGSAMTVKLRHLTKNI